MGSRFEILSQKQVSRSGPIFLKCRFEILFQKRVRDFHSEAGFTIGSNFLKRRFEILIQKWVGDFDSDAGFFRAVYDIEKLVSKMYSKAGLHFILGCRLNKKN